MKINDYINNPLHDHPAFDYFETRINQLINDGKIDEIDRWSCSYDCETGIFHTPKGDFI